MLATDFLQDGPDHARATLILAHGAGAPMDSPFMAFIAQGMGQNGIRTIRFEFPYMRRRRLQGKRSPPNPAAKLLESWRETVSHHRGQAPLFIGGKSMGGRFATMIADEVGAAGTICYGYPFHPPGKPEKLRTAHLEALATPCLIIQGERDPFGNTLEVNTYQLAKNISIAWLPDGDHSFKPRKSSSDTQAQHWQTAMDQTISFIQATLAAENP